MTTITTQLAEALRALLVTTGQRPVMVAQIRDAEPEAIKALAAYDAARDNGETFVKAPEQPDIYTVNSCTRDDGEIVWSIKRNQWALIADVTDEADALELVRLLNKR